MKNILLRRYEFTLAQQPIVRLDNFRNAQKPRLLSEKKMMGRWNKIRSKHIRGSELTVKIDTEDVIGCSNLRRVLMEKKIKNKISNCLLV